VSERGYLTRYVRRTKRIGRRLHWLHCSTIKRSGKYLSVGSCIVCGTLRWFSATPFTEKFHDYIGFGGCWFLCMHSDNMSAIPFAGEQSDVTWSVDFEANELSEFRLLSNFKSNLLIYNVPISANTTRRQIIWWLPCFGLRRYCMPSVISQYAAWFFLFTWIHYFLGMYVHWIQFISIDSGIE